MFSPNLPSTFRAKRWIAFIKSFIDSQSWFAAPRPATTIQIANCIQMLAGALHCRTTSTNQRGWWAEYFKALQTQSCKMKFACVRACGFERSYHPAEAARSGLHGRRAGRQA
jgi:hypothetical protein